MSRINGEKARAAIAKKGRTAQREKDRAKLQELRTAAAATTEKKSDSRTEAKSK